MKTCKSCIYRYPEKNECHRNPPMAVLITVPNPLDPNRPNGRVLGVYPPCPETPCGEWKESVDITVQ